MISRISLLDISLDIQLDDHDVEGLNNACELFNHYINEAKNNLSSADSQTITLIAGLNMARAFLKQQQQGGGEQQQLNERLAAIENKLQQALKQMAP